MICIICYKPLTNRQTKFCSRICKGKHHNSKHQTYDNQRSKAITRKLEFVKLLGGECVKCGYKKNLAALQFHHLDPSTKSFSLDLHFLGNRSYKACADEACKCSLLCAVCHTELHNPQFNII